MSSSAIYFIYDCIRESSQEMRGYWPGLLVTCKSTLGRDTDFGPSSNKKEEFFSALMKCNMDLNILYPVEENSVQQLEARVSVTARNCGTRTRMMPNDTASISNGVSEWDHS